MENSTSDIRPGELLKATVSNVIYESYSCIYWGKMLVQALEYYATLQESVNKMSILKWVF